MAINIHRVYGIFMPFFRRRRARLFKQVMSLPEGVKVLDVGGHHTYWQYMDCSNPVELLNVYLPKLAEPLPPRFTYTIGDGRTLPYGDEQFPLAFSNSVIEHVGSLEDQRRFAEEIRRVGRDYWVQTPSRWFPVEPHLIALFIHYLPFGLKRRLVRWCSGWGLVTKPTQRQVDECLQGIRLLTEREMRALFPDAEIFRERVLFLTKSFIAVRRKPVSARPSMASGAHESAA